MPVFGLSVSRMLNTMRIRQTHAQGDTKRNRSRSGRRRRATRVSYRASNRRGRLTRADSRAAVMPRRWLGVKPYWVRKYARRQASLSARRTIPKHDHKARNGGALRRLTRARFRSIWRIKNGDPAALEPTHK